jgi:glycosyltransferase involved in cell wall biosynthesis
VSSPQFPGRLAVQQRVLPSYRVPFFELLAKDCAGGMSLFAGQPMAKEGIITATTLARGELENGHNLHLLSGQLYMCYQHGLLGWLERVNPEALVLEANPRYLSSAAAARWMHSRGRPVIGWGIGAPPVSGAFEAARRARRRGFVQRFDTLVAYSERGAQEYAALGFQTDRILVAHNAVAAAPLQAAPSRPASPSRHTVLFVGRLQRRKRVDRLLRACSNVPAPRLVIVGDGPERGPERLARTVFLMQSSPGAKRWS